MKTEKAIKKEVDRLDNLIFGLRKFNKFKLGDKVEQHMAITFSHIRKLALKWVLK